MNDMEFDRIDEFRQKAVKLYNHPKFIDLQNLLMLRLPEDTEVLFKKINTIYNNKNINSPFNDIRRRANKTNDRYAHKLLFEGVRDGLTGCFYHVLNFLELEQIIKQQGPELIKLLHPEESITLGIPNQKLIFEYEAFTYSSRSVLDRWNWFINYYFMKDAGNLYKLESILKSSCIDNEQAKRIIKIINKHRNFLDAQISSEKGKTERDRIAHREQISFASINIRYNKAENSIAVQLLSPFRTSDEDAGEILISRFGQLKSFIEESVQAFFDDIN
jgi:hypothetical protein